MMMSLCSVWPWDVGTLHEAFRVWFGAKKVSRWGCNVVHGGVFAGTKKDQKTKHRALLFCCSVGLTPACRRQRVYSGVRTRLITPLVLQAPYYGKPLSGSHQSGWDSSRSPEYTTEITCC